MKAELAKLDQADARSFGVEDKGASVFGACKHAVAFAKLYHHQLQGQDLRQYKGCPVVLLETGLHQDTA